VPADNVDDGRDTLKINIIYESRVDKLLPISGITKTNLINHYLMLGVKNR